ncbi:MAG: hypothetical protein GY778_18465, partial [bacterium]|nr:hypothetical protein [bacterium]
LEIGLRHNHPACVLAAAEAMGAPFGRPQKTFNALVSFWERLDAWAKERPQLKSEVAYPLLVRIVKANLKTLSDETFGDAATARAWYQANRRNVGRR